MYSLNVVHRYIPKNFEPAELKKVKLQEQMSGLKHDFSAEIETNLQKASAQADDDESEIDPIDECKNFDMGAIQTFGLTWIHALCVLDLILISFFVSIVLHEIQERMDWLEEMEKLGEGRSYKALIKSEIEERLRAIKRLQTTETGVKQWFFGFLFLSFE